MKPGSTNGYLSPDLSRVQSVGCTSAVEQSDLRIFVTQTVEYSETSRAFYCHAEAKEPHSHEIAVSPSIQLWRHREAYLKRIVSEQHKTKREEYNI